MSTEMGRQATPQEIAAAEAAAAIDRNKVWAELGDDNADTKLLPADNGDDHDTGFPDPGENDKDSTVEIEKAPPAEVKVEQPATAITEPDWTSAPPELRAAYEAEKSARLKAENAYKADQGRIRKMQSTFDRLQNSAKKGADETKIAETLKESLADYPEILKPVSAAFDQIDKKLERVEIKEGEEQTAQLAEVDTHVQQQQEVLDGLVPGWQTKPYLADVEANKQFLLWVNDQPAEFREIVFKTNQKRIFDGHGAAQVMTAYEAHLAATAKKPAVPASQPPAPSKQELSPKRAAQLSALDSPKSTARSPVRSGTPKEVEDRDAHWKEIGDDNPDERLERRRA